MHGSGLRGAYLRLTHTELLEQDRPQRRRDPISEVRCGSAQLGVGRVQVPDPSRIRRERTSLSEARPSVCIGLAE